MDVGYQWHVASLLAQQVPHHANAFGLANTLCRQAHQLASGIGDALALRCTAFNVVGVGVGHRLNSHGPFTAQLHPAHIDGDCIATLVVKHALYNS